MKILISGASGFIGTALIKRLSKEKGYNLVIAGRDEIKLQSLSKKYKCKYICFDINQKQDNWFELLGKPDILLHLAWGNLDNFNAVSHIRNELPSHLEFLLSMIKSGLKKLVVSGTCLEYGLTNGELKEEMVTNPVTLYGIAKDTLRRSLEIMCRDNSIKLTWLRYFYMFGDGQKENSVLSLLETAVKNGETVFNMSGGEQIRDFLPIEKVVEYTTRVVTSSVDGILNICSGEPISINYLLERRRAELHSDIYLNRGFYSYPEYEPMAFWGDTRKLNKIIRNDK